MARLKSTPTRATKRKAQERTLRESSRVKTNKRLRLSNVRERFPPLSSRRSRKRVTATRQDEDSHLPPELRKAGLMAHMLIPKGKRFGPFHGKIVNKKKSPDKKHFFVSQLQDKRGRASYFFAQKNEKEKCSWLSRLQSAASEHEQNIAAYNHSMGVCFEALKDIAAKEELLALFDENFAGTHGLAENDTSSIPYITDENGREIAVVSLDEVTDRSAVYINPDDGDEGPTDEVRRTEENEEHNCSENEEDMDAESEDGSDEDTSDVGGIEDENESSEDDNDDDDDYVPERMSKVKKCSIRVDDDDDDDDNDDDSDDDNDDNDDNMTADKNHGNQKHQLKKLIIKKVISIGEDDGKELVKYQCSHCVAEFVERKMATQHRTSRECLSRVFQCDTCTQEFKSGFFLQKHKCGGKPNCHVCDKEFEDWKAFEAHKKEPPAEHAPKCIRCDMEFNSVREKQYHVRLVHGPTESPEECPICNKPYNKVYLKQHLKTHEESDALKCRVCGKGFSSKSNLNKHVKKHEPGYKPAKERKREKKHSCSDCEKRFDTLHSLQVHQRSHTGERPYQCDKCEWKFIQKTHLRRHIQLVHEKGENQNRARRGERSQNTSVTCEVCNKVYVNNRVLVVHMRSVHQGERPHKCNYCEATYTQRGHLWRHMHASHFETEEVQKKYCSDKFCCNFDGCEQAFSEEPDLVEHVKTHTTTKPCMCNQCGATFVSTGNLNKHTKRRHSGRPRTVQRCYCDKCDKSFPTSYQLQLHFRSHTGEKPYHCDLCGKDFVQKAGLRKHIKCKRCPMIEGPSENPSAIVRKYACEHCEKMFPGPSDLRAHMRSHTGERPYQCSVCQKGFSQPGNLTKHVRYIHEKQKRPKEKAREKKFFCSLCGKAFLCPSSLAMHCRTHSGHKPFPCKECGQAFTQAGNLKKHMKRWHEEGAEPKQRGKNKKNNGQQSKSVGTSLQATGPDTDISESNPTVQSMSEAEGNGGETGGTQNSIPTTTTQSVVSTQSAFTNIATNTSLNSSSVFFSTTPLNTAIPSGRGNATGQRQATPTAEEQSSIVSTTEPVVISSAPSFTSQQGNLPTVSVTTSAIVTPNPNINNMTAQQFQQLMLSGALTPVTGVESVFLPPNVGGASGGGVPGPPTLLPQVHTILTPAASTAFTGIGPSNVLMAPSVGTDVTIFPFSPTNLFQH